MHSRLVAPAVSIALAFALALTACVGRRFEPASVVNKFRVLGMQAEPPELRPSGTTTVRLLTSTPNDEDVHYRWDWCPFATSGGNYFECPVTQQQLEEQGGGVFVLPDFDLGTDDHATLAYPLPHPMLVAFCKALAQATVDAAEGSPLERVVPQLSCDEHYEVSVRVVASTAGPVTDAMLADLRGQDPSRVIVASKRVSLWLGSENEQDINPIVEQLQIRPLREEDQALLLEAGHAWTAQIDDFEDDWVTIPEDEPLPILVGVRYELRALVMEDSIQTYAKLAPQGSTSEDRYVAPKSEVLVYNWFTTAGAFSSPESLYLKGSTLLDEASRTDLFIPTTDTSQDFGGANGARFIASCPALEDGDPDSGCVVNVWAVVRDDRRGQGWLQRSLLATGIHEEATTDLFGGLP